MFYVYCIKNKLNGKVYVGKSKDAIKRFRIHLKIAKGGKEKYSRKFHAIHAAITKYGIENFSFEILYKTLTESESFELEAKTISHLKENNLPTYNLSNGGEGNSGWHHTPESRLKMSKARKGKKFSLEHCKALSEAQSGEKHSQFGTHQTTKWKEAKAKLTALQVREIKQLLLLKTPYKKIAEIYKISISLISQIKRNKIWKEITLN